MLNELRRAVDPANAHEWRTAVLSTLDETGAPDARTVVLRGAQGGPSGLEQLRFYTDARSTKMAQIARDPRGHVLFWSRALGVQLRIGCEVATVTEGPEVAAAWADLIKWGLTSDYIR